MKEVSIGHTLAISEYSALVNSYNLRRTSGFVGYLPKIDYSVIYIFKYDRICSVIDDYILDNLLLRVSIHPQFKENNLGPS